MSKKADTKLGGLDQCESALRNRFCTDPDLRNDWDFWAQYIEDGSPLFEEFRMFLARVLRGEENRPARRPKNTHAKLMRHINIIVFVCKQWDAGVKPNDAVKKAVEHFKLDERTISRVLAEKLPSMFVRRDLNTLRKKILTKDHSFKVREGRLRSRFEELKKRLRKIPRDARANNVQQKLLAKKQLFEVGVRNYTGKITKIIRELDELQKLQNELSRYEIEQYLKLSSE